jgi:thioredoxin reductase (NADPH)
VRRFGKARSYRAGEALVQVGNVGPGLTIILTGWVDITQHDDSGRRRHIVTHGPGSFMGELAQLAGRPTLVDEHAQDEVEALIIPPDRLRALLIGEAELGEHVMRALILRRVGLLETGAGGPVIVGLPQNGDVLRLEGFLRRNGHPYQRLDPETDADAKVLVERFHVDTDQLPIVLCPGGQLLRNPTEPELARGIGLLAPIDPKRACERGSAGSGVALDAKGFVLIGGDCNETRNPLETSRRGIFAIGDVRSGSIKRVAAAVGEGAQVVATLHATLASMESKIPGESAAQA